MSDWQSEQLDTLLLVKQFLAGLDSGKRREMSAKTAEYLRFRRETDHFLVSHFGRICTRNCYTSKLSACCSREGIITFFGEIVINALVSSPGEIARLEHVLKQPNQGFKCVYLGAAGCLWQVRPVVCALFLCDAAQNEVFDPEPSLRVRWENFKSRAKRFKWPDRPVLFDELEALFINEGYSSPLMYLHNSPGLLRIKRRSGLLDDQNFTRKVPGLKKGRSL